MKTARQFALDVLIDALRSVTEEPRTPWSLVRIAKPPLYPADPELRRLPPQIFRGDSVEELFHVWEQATYGFLATQELFDEGFTEGSWAKACAPFAYPYLLGFRKQIRTALYPVLLCTIGSHPDLELKTEDGLLVVGGEYEIGVRGGKVVSKYSEGVDVEFDMTTITSPLPGHVIIDHPVLLVAYATIRLISDDEQRTRAMAMLSQLVFRSGQKEVAQELAPVFKAFANFFESIENSYPKDTEIEKLLLESPRKDIARVLYQRLKPCGISRRVFLKEFGAIDYEARRTEAKAYDLIYKYRDFLRRNTSC